MSDRELFEAFQKRWSLENVKKMTLEEYTSIQQDNPNRDDFTFWIESKLESIGSIWGGSSFKFGIYRRNEQDSRKNERGRIYDDKYAWLERCGATRDEAFKNVKKAIVDIIIYSQNNELRKIDEITLFGPAYKWKIAFHYQKNLNDIGIVCIFSEEILKQIAKYELDNENLLISEVHKNLLSDKKYTLEKMFEEKSIPLWNKYAPKDEKNSGDSMAASNNLNSTKAIPLNQILYGPPGTGKTYHTINKALEILGFCHTERSEVSNDNLDYEKIKQKLEELGLSVSDSNDEKAKRANAKALFDYYKDEKQGQIAFITFHQSFSYEEFIEGIKPKLDSESESAESSDMGYEIKDGIFKKICKEAMRITKSTESTGLEFDNNTAVWKVSLGGVNLDYTQDLQKHCFENNEIRIGWKDTSVDSLRKSGETNNASSIECFENAMRKGDFVCILKTQTSIQAVGIITGDFEIEKRTDGLFNEFQRYRKVKWLCKGVNIDIFKENGSINLTLKTVYRLWRITPEILLEKIKNKLGTESELEVISDNTKKPYILIIDEINRGNIAKILGELITLIEPSKRIGASDEEKARGIGDEALSVALPYSNEIFGVPSNLYIIGTMNTADRSIALLDSALRRRFEFIEMMPRADLLGDCAGVNLQELLRKMNNRIEFLLDREHRLGHAYLINVRNLEALRGVFANKIIPLLQEYFYDDYAKICAVLNDNGMIEKRTMSDLGINLNEDLVDSEKVIYRISDSRAWKIEHFKKIYE